ncbi:MAG: hypothetical protein PVF73_10275 [Bacteroidales bacterium]|jgi:hypothetical protein
MKKTIVTGLILLCSFSYGQENNALSSVDFHGYVSAMPSLYWMEDSSAWQALLHNRLNLDWYPTDRISGSIQLRNQLIAGEFVEITPIDNGFNKENYFLPLTYQQKFADRYLLSLSIDRAWLQYTYNQFEIKLGRQRINWGQTFVWNPNDLFNSYNFFDIDYPERPGADALRMQYYTGFTSSIDLAAKLDSSGNVTGGAMYHFNLWNTDFQVLAAYFRQSNKLELAIDSLRVPIKWEDRDLVGGFGFSGAISNLSIRGELSYFYSLESGNNSSDQLLTSLAFDYSFPDQTYLMFEFFYNSNVQLSGTSFLNFYGGSQNVKTMTFTKYNAFGQVTYPVTPLINATLGAMYFYDKMLTGFYTGPSVEVSLTDNLGLSAFFQFFAFQYDSPNTTDKEWTKSNFAFLRLKWNF